MACADGATNKQVTSRLGIAASKVNRWRARFIAARLVGPADEPRPSRPPPILLTFLGYIKFHDVVIGLLGWTGSFLCQEAMLSWLRGHSGSVWPVSLAHTGNNMVRRCRL
ncbi:hypothetical protein [Actinoallomurus acaciae]|uniref:Helix-turn-helix domain-containing protein n=1 Tax=Actinoallomurus acaciae TaxID=502577 RepID=A0ABV5YNH0_9ACTN